MRIFDIDEQLFVEIKRKQDKILDLLVKKIEEKSRTIYAIDDVAKIFKVTSRTIYNWKESGILPYTQIGSKTYLTQMQLDEFLMDHQVKSVKVGGVL